MNPGFLTSRSAFFATSSQYQCRAGHGHTLRPARPRLLPFLQLSVKHDRLQWRSLASLFAPLLDSLSPGFSLLTFRGGQKWAYGCEYMKYRVFSLYYYLFMIVWFSIRTSVRLLLPSLYNRNTILSVASLGSIFTLQPEKHEARWTLTGVARTLLVTLWVPVVLCNSQSMSTLSCLTLTTTLRIWYLGKKRWVACSTAPVHSSPSEVLTTGMSVPCWTEVSIGICLFIVQQMHTFHIRQSQSSKEEDNVLNESTVRKS